MTLLDKLLIGNSIISLGSHLFFGVRWVGKSGVSTEKKAISLLHIRNKHPAKFGKCTVDDCLTITSQKYQEALPQLESQR